MAIPQPAARLRQIDPASVQRNDDNPRIIFRQEEMESLLLSIDKYGVQVPISVYEHNDGYTLIDGERRWRCAAKLNLKTIPALIREKPSDLENLLLMYNIHALREQWDYYTIASKLQRVITLFEQERGAEPNEIELSQATGLTRGQIRRCRLLLGLPPRFQDMLLEELKRPKTQQQLSEDFFIEMEKALKTVTRRLPKYEARIDGIRDVLIQKFRTNVITAVTDFRHLSKIATAVGQLGLTEKKAQQSLDRVFDPKSSVGIRRAYQETVEFDYDERKARHQVEALNGFLDSVIEGGQKGSLDAEFVQVLRELYQRLKRVLTT